MGAGHVGRTARRRPRRSRRRMNIKRVSSTSRHSASTRSEPARASRTSLTCSSIWAPRPTRPGISPPATTAFNNALKTPRNLRFKQSAYYNLGNALFRQGEEASSRPIRKSTLCDLATVARCVRHGVAAEALRRGCQVQPERRENPAGRIAQTAAAAATAESGTARAITRTTRTNPRTRKTRKTRRGQQNQPNQQKSPKSARSARPAESAVDAEPARSAGSAGPTKAQSGPQPGQDPQQGRPLPLRTSVNQTSCHPWRRSSCWIPRRARSGTWRPACATASLESPAATRFGTGNETDDATWGRIALRVLAPRRVGLAHRACGGGRAVFGIP